MASNKRSAVWQYFEVSNDDKSKTLCQLCNAVLVFKGKLNSM